LQSHLQCTNARSLSSIPESVADNSNQKSNSTATSSGQRANKNNTELVSLAESREEGPVMRNSLSHILREKRAAPEIILAVNFHMMHQHCDLDQNRVEATIDNLLSHCIEVYNKRYMNEGHYRLYKYFQLEAFFFGQYYERMKRFETNPHTWDYSYADV
ncbi:hypothetical protein KR093_011014, partial [Drosophila rubida]